MVEIKIPAKIENNFEGYKGLASISRRIQSLNFEEIKIDFSEVKWFHANMLSMLGAIIDSGWTNSITLRNIKEDQEKIFRKNRFLSHFGGAPLPDSYQTTVEYRKSKIDEIGNFEKYLSNKLLGRRELPNMSPLLSKKIKESILEIFNNARMHGESLFVYSCGQYFPKIKRIDFTITDIGKTIRKNVRDHLKKSELSGKEAIEWAVEGNNTTKTGNIPGGLGLKMIRDFLRMNGGRMQIISADGFWQEENNKTISSSLSPDFFKGTVVNLEFNVNDTQSYCLTTENEDRDIPF